MKHADGARLAMYAAVGEQIRLQREKASLRACDVAPRVGIAAGTLLAIEKGGPCPLHVLVKLADVFDCTLDDLVPV